jgi:hypothetical protein
MCVSILGCSLRFTEAKNALWDRPCHYYMALHVVPYNNWRVAVRILVKFRMMVAPLEASPN